MKRLIKILIIFGLVSSGFAYADDKGQFLVQTEYIYQSWKDNFGSKGSQTVMPFTLTYQKGGLDIGVRRAYIDSVNRTPGLSGQVNTWSDTSVSTAYTMRSNTNLPVKLSLSANLPNGKATLTGDEKNAIMDGQLVWQTRFGEGFNITPGVSIAHSLTDKDTIGAGISYGYRGKFDPNADVEKDDIDPGDETIATLQYSRTNNRSQMGVSTSYKHSQTTRRNSQDYYQKGAVWSIDADGSYAFNEKHSMYGGYYYAYSKKDKYINNLTGNLEIEDFNSNGKTHHLNAGYVYRFSPVNSVSLIADYLKIDGNSYDQINILYVPARKKWSVGMQYRHQLLNNLNMNVSIKRFRMQDDASPYLPEQTYKGWNVYSGLTYQF